MSLLFAHASYFHLDEDRYFGDTAQERFPTPRTMYGLYPVDRHERLLAKLVGVGKAILFG